MNKLKLNSNIFSIIHVKKAITAYKDICKIDINEINNYIACEFKDCVYDLEETKKEFENYVINLMNTNNTL